MSTLPASGYFENAARTEGEMKAAFEDQRDVIAELPGASAETELTISAGAVTPTLGIHSIDTEADAATDDLANIVTTNHPDGRLLYIHPEDDARTVVVKHAAGGAGQIHLKNDADFQMDDTEDWLLLSRDGTDWEEIDRGRSHKRRSVTISGGVAALTGPGAYAIDTEGAAATDDLTQCTGLADAEQATLKIANAARFVLVKNGANMKLQGAADFQMNSIYDRIVLEGVGSGVCVEISRSSPA